MVTNFYLLGCFCLIQRSSRLTHSMENRLARLWLGLFVFTATFSRSAQQALCSRSSDLLLCFGSEEDIVDLRDHPGIGNRKSVERM